MAETNETVRIKVLLDASDAKTGAKESVRAIGQVETSTRKASTAQREFGEAGKQTGADLAAQRNSIADLNARIKNLTEARDKFADPKTISRYNDKIRQLQGHKEELANSTRKVSKETTTVSGVIKEAFGPNVPLVGRYSQRIEQARAAQVSLTGSTKAFKIALAATGIGALIVALGTLVQAFRSTQEGTDTLNRFLIPLKATFSALWGVVQDVSLFFAGELKQAIKDPAESAKSLGAAIKENIINRFTSGIEVGRGFGKVLKGVLSRDFEMIKEGSRQAADGVLQFATGIENSSDKIANWGKNIADSSREAFESGKRIQSLTEQIEQLRIDQEVPLSSLKREYRELYNIARDTTVSEEERLKAAEEAINKRRQIRDMEVELLDLEIEKLELQQSLNDTSREERLELEKLKAQREEAAARTEQELSRILSARNAIINSIENEAKAEEEKARKAEEAAAKKAAAEAKAEKERIEALEKSSEKYSNLLLSEEELAEQSYQKRLAELQVYVDEGIFTQEEFYAIQKVLEEELAAQKAELIQAERDARREAQREAIEQAAEYAQAVGQAFQLISEFQGAATEARIDKLEKEKEAALSSIDSQLQNQRLSERTRARLTEERQATEEKYQEKIEKLQREQFERERKAKLAEIAMNTAVAIAKIWSQQGLGAIITQSFAAAMGIGQAAIVMKQPNPYLEGGFVEDRLKSGMSSPGKKIISINENDRPEFIVNAESAKAAGPLLSRMNASPAFARQVSELIRRSGSPIPPADIVNRTNEPDTDIASAIREGMAGVIIRPRIAVTEINEAQTKRASNQRAVGNQG